MDIDVGFGLWLCADEDAEERLTAAISELAARFGGPAFSPHLTLASGFGTQESALEAAHGAARELDDIQLRFSEVESTAEYYRALYLRADEHAVLSACHERLLQGTQRPDRTFIPHVSLFYGDLGPRRTEALEAARALVPLSTRAAAIEVWELRGPFAAWRKRDRLALPSTRRRPPVGP
jgi:2'-5' RNA ligase